MNKNNDGGLGRMLRTLLILAGCFMVLLILSGVLALAAGNLFPANTRSSYLTQSVVQALVAFVGTAVATALLATRQPWRFLGLVQPVSWKPFMAVIIVYIIGMPALNQVIYYNSLMSLPQWMSGIEKYMQEMEELTAGVTETILNTTTISGLITGILIIGFLTGFAEELLFRGTLQRALNQDIYIKQWSIWLAAIVFSSVHLQFYGFIPRLLLGAFFGYLLYSTNSIWPGVFAHALNNSIVVVTAWIEKRCGGSINAEQWGVVDSGFPWVAAGSTILLILFFLYLYPRLVIAVKETRELTENKDMDTDSTPPVIRF